MASLRGNTTLFDGDLATGVASPWAYVGSATDVTLYLDDGGGSANWSIEVAVGNGQAGLNGISTTDPDAVPFGVLSSRLGAAHTIASAGSPVAFNLSPFAAQYIRVRPDADVTGGSARINTVSRNSRSLRGHQVLWNNADLTAGDFSAVGFVGDESNAVIFLDSADASDSFEIQVAAGAGTPGMNEIPGSGDWSVLHSSDTGDQILFSAAVGTKVAIDLSPFGGNFIRLKAIQDTTGVTATLAVSD